MTQSRLTINVQCSYVADWGKTLDFLRQLNPVAVVACIDNMSAKNRIDELKRELPNTQVIARCIIIVHDNGVQKELDGGMHLAPQAPGDTNHYVVSPDNFLNTYHELGENGLILSYMNEPMIAGATDMVIDRQVAHILETVEKATTRGISLCVGNWGVGHYLTPAFDNVLRLMSKYRDKHTLGIHLYAPIDTLTALTMVTSRCTTLGIKPPRIHVSEYGYDSSSPTDQLNGYKSRGYTGLQFATWQKVAINNVYKYLFVDDILQSVATFTWGNEVSWKNFNVETDADWQKEILDFAQRGALTVDKSPTPAPIPAPVPVPVPEPPKPPAPPAEKMITLPASIINKLRVDTQACVDVTDRMGQEAKQTGEKMVLLGQRAIAASRDLSDDLSVLNSFIRDSMST